MTTQNVFVDDWDVEQSQPGYTWKRMRLGRRLGGELLGASVYELPPGEATWPLEGFLRPEWLDYFDGEPGPQLE